MRELTNLFLTKENQVLLAMKKRGFGAGRWNGVGGKIDPGESVNEAMVRECQEEIHVSPTITNRVAEIIFDERHGGKRETLVVHVFICTAWQGKPQETEEMSPRWFNIDEIPYEQMWADDIYWLPKILGGKLLRASFILDETDAVTGHEIREVEKL